MTDRVKQGRNNRRRGYTMENNLAKWHRQNGIPARRVPGSGAIEGHDGDLRIGNAPELYAEAKGRKNGGGFIMLQRWLSGNDVLFVSRGPTRAPMVVMDQGLYLKLMQAYARECGWRLDEAATAPRETIPTGPSFSPTTGREIRRLKPSYMAGIKSGPGGSARGRR